MRVHIPHIHAAHKHRPGACVPEPGDQAGSRGLSASGRAHQGHGLSRLHREGYMGQGRRLGTVVSKAHVPKLHPSILRDLRLAWNRKFRRIHHLGDAAKGRVGQHHAGGGEHDPRQRRGDNGGEHGIEGEVCNKPWEIPFRHRAGSQKQRCRHQEYKGALGEG